MNFNCVSILAVGLGDLLGGYVMVAVMVGAALLSLGMFLASRYKRCPSNKILVIYGKVGSGRSATTVHGGGKLVLPIIQDYAYLPLEPIQIEVPLKDALSSENIRVNVPSVFTVAIGTEPELMQNAAIRLLGLDNAHVKKQAEDIIFGQLRQVIASMLIEDINRDREQFLSNIQNSLEPELRKIGLVLINVNITDITDESGYIEAIGQKAASEAVQKARGDVAEQEKLGEIRVVAAERDKMIEVANAQREQEIGIRSAEREKTVRVAELSKEEEYGKQKALFEQDTLVAEANKEKRISVSNANADAYKGEAEADAEVAEAQATLQVKKAEAYERAKTREKEAEASVLEAQNRAMAKAALAEAEKVEAEQRAQLEAPAKAEKARTIVNAEAAAAKKKLDAEAEAAAIYAKLEAEARGNYEILAKKGEGLREIISACGGSKEAFQMLLLEHLDNLAEASAEAISNIKFDKVVVWEGGGGNGEQTNVSNFLQGMSRTLPPMLQVMKDIGGVELPETFIRMAGEDVPSSNGQPTAKEETAPTSTEKEAVAVSKPASSEPKPKPTTSTKKDNSPKKNG
ncbi:MAG: flotillin family protein [Planctomycetaceae bacterium]|nr:flotillin family protein [Planctomycetaceae bacterium]